MASLVNDLSDGVRLIQLMVRSTSSVSEGLLKDYGRKSWACCSLWIERTVTNHMATQATSPSEDTIRIPECEFRRQRTLIKR